MKKLIKRIALALATIASVSAMSLAPVYATTNQAKSDVCAGAAITGANCADGGIGLNGVITNVINILSAVIGVAAVIMIILAGFKYITSGGDPSGVKSAKDSLIYAIVGLLVVALAQTIVRFVLHAA
ncbi:MAG: pilin [Candidatus Saccharimonadales bacterium]